MEGQAKRVGIVVREEMCPPSVRTIIPMRWTIRLLQAKTARTPPQVQLEVASSARQEVPEPGICSVGAPSICAGEVFDIVVDSGVEVSCLSVPTRIRCMRLSMWGAA